MADDLIVCRCEEVTLGELRALLAEGVATAHGLKLFSRAGMGMCQGRTCRPLIEALVGQAATSERPSAYRMPVRPVLISDVATLNHDEHPS
jgi:NAD(P)H-nitrite reductase large subunit